jgi:CRP-like cAMP-binding protein
MLHTINGDIGNGILDAAPPSILRSFGDQAEPVRLGRRHVFLRPDEEIEDVYFPTSSVASWLATLSDGKVAEVATIGNEGLVGAPLIYGERSSPFMVINQVPGDALRLPAPVFTSALQEDAAFRGLMTRYLDALVVQIGQSAACNSLHSVLARTARWVLMTRDRTGKDELELTHELLADMLGVSRPTVTAAVGELQERGLVQSVWGQLRILDRPGLEGVVCECYGIITARYQRMQPGSQ